MTFRTQPTIGRCNAKKTIAIYLFWLWATHCPGEEHQAIAKAIDGLARLGIGLNSAHDPRI
eukprot:scaffold124522_cov44-Tisochrysis_lutea.AAC.1